MPPGSLSIFQGWRRLSAVIDKRCCAIMNFNVENAYSNSNLFRKNGTGNQDKKGGGFRIKNVLANFWQKLKPVYFETNIISIVLFKRLLCYNLVKYKIFAFGTDVKLDFDGVIEWVPNHSVTFLSPVSTYGVLPLPSLVKNFKLLFLNKV